RSLADRRSACNHRKEVSPIDFRWFRPGIGDGLLGLRGLGLPRLRLFISQELLVIFLRHFRLPAEIILCSANRLVRPVACFRPQVDFGFETLLFLLENFSRCALFRHAKPPSISISRNGARAGAGKSAAYWSRKQAMWNERAAGFPLGSKVCTRSWDGFLVRP